jgi:hypothetical protein
MKSFLVIAPILPGKFERWKEMQTITQDQDAAALAKEGGVERVRFWSFKTPDGGDMAAVLHEGPAPENWMPTIMGSDHPVAVKFRAMAEEVHGMTADAMEGGPPPPAFVGDVSFN